MSWKTKIPLIAILRGIKAEEVVEHIDVLIDAGFDTIEIPLNSPDWQKSIAIAVNTFGDKALIGAGTVLKSSQVDELNQLGCKLIVTPNINPAVIKKAVEYGMVVCPGCATATEAFEAIDAGAQNLKIFPSVAFGPSYIKALKAVLPKDIPVFSVGGITPENLHEYINAGCIGAGLGSDLYKVGQTVEITKQKAISFINAYSIFNN
ncbi:2-dehydro-3-deoxy-6-phosphogalactonate aldolase [Orbus mooreae]|uniref:2-dehydro-3-deoxy-6-phosphogalactonate aldolase n=1 Tax=Orbus mooreae TaxID=3074107 RepID=UPI00370D29BC